MEVSSKSVAVIILQYVRVSNQQVVTHYTYTMVYVKCISIKPGGGKDGLHNVRTTGEMFSTSSRLTIIAFRKH